ncbi:MAG TPA: SEC-C metal-binding domain-containing protein, partial [Roseiarcus sp.]|nr:SEC-C metal-binding domain-containing protein [Roseiarcus sp.]
DAMRAYLMRLRREMKPREESYVWQIWAETAANLGYDDLRPELASLHAADRVEPREFGLGHFDEQVKLARRDAAGLAGFEADHVSPFDKAIDTLATWSYGGARAAEDWEPDDGFVVEEPNVNPLRGIGRNDPCPCGSGKKYKRCCLAG